MDFRQGTFRVRGDTVEVFPMYGRYAVRIEFWGDEIDRMLKLDPLEGEVKSSEPAVLVHPAEHYSIPEEQLEGAISEIEELMEQRVKHFQRQGDLVAAQRIEERTTFDIEMLRETGHCSGIENYSVHLSDREPGDAPYTLLDYFPDDFLTVIDESHVTLPQIKGQYAGDKSRKDSLVENGFRLPTAYDNRPLTFEEFERDRRADAFRLRDARRLRARPLRPGRRADCPPDTPRRPGGRNRLGDGARRGPVRTHR